MEKGDLRRKVYAAVPAGAFTASAMEKVIAEATARVVGGPLCPAQLAAPL